MVRAGIPGGQKTRKHGQRRLRATTPTLSSDGSDYEPVVPVASAAGSRPQKGRSRSRSRNCWRLTASLGNDLRTISVLGNGLLVGSCQ